MLQQHANFPSELAGEASELRNLARFLVRGDEAQDLAQDTMVTALSQRTRPRAIRPWLRQVLRNEHRARVRADIRRRARESRVETPAPASMMDDDAVRTEVIVALRTALEELAEPYREVLRMRFFEDATAAEIARLEGCPAGTVRWRVQEGLRRIRRKLDERFEDREAWFGSMAAFAGLPLAPPSAAPTPQGASMMTKATLLKILIAAGTVAGGTALVASGSVVSASADDVGERTSVASSYEAAKQERTYDASALSLARAEVAEEPIDPEPPADDGEQCANIECAADPDGSQLGTDLNGCLSTLDLEAGERLDVWLLLDDERKVVGAELDEARFGVVADEVTDCLAESLEDLALPEFEEADAPSKVQIQLVLDGDNDGLPDGLADVVDADAPDPAALAKAFKLRPRGAGEEAAVTIVECAEFDCPFCGKARNTIDRIVADYEGKVAVYWLNKPLPSHAGAEPAARASVAAANQDKFWEMADLLFDNPGQRTEEAFVGFAAELGLDVKRFVEDLGAEATAQAVRDQAAACEGNGARGTPSFFINGDLVVGARPYEAFKSIIDDELAS